MIVVTAATGHLGRLVIKGLLDAGVPAGDIVAAVRNPEKATDLGVATRLADYTRPETLAAAFEGASKVLLISSSTHVDRPGQHAAVADAAKAAGVEFLAYTSLLRADTNTVGLAPDHKASEEHIAASGLRYTFLRNGWYFENYTQNAAQSLAGGAVYGAALDGKISGATRADYAAAAVAVLLAEDPAEVYELAGDNGFTLSELAAEYTAQTGTPVSYQDLGQDGYQAALLGAGLPEFVANLLSDADAAVSRGELQYDGGDLAKLIGRPTTTLTEAVAAALAK
ncbi:NAD(P)-dependent oxidoreductase [Actinorhabdospora filicis]|uniref:NAD(P)-dependent oxidoreductase n=1 Tax=Actinorhabdospora filicis TaxID=1785913 RepID=A0A9W6W913_9ACTN|nr:NAD(P)H-binding protein [Actinorhabdospora filicis]GLZ76205.1 NAD(P)-dependent oxidoreductase [Actinorhabdospora filicis]